MSFPSVPAQRISHPPGFSLFELALVLLIVSLLTLASAEFMSPLLATSRLTATRANINQIVKALSIYAQRNNRIPCPADPNAASITQPEGAEVGSGINGATTPDVLGQGGCKKGAAAFNEGVVPYRTLGMPKGATIDAWGRYISYRVSPSFAIDPSPSAATIAPAHGRCRVAPAWIVGAGGSSGIFSKNGLKARFCCPARTLAASDIKVQDTSGRNLWPQPRDASPANYAAVDIPAPSAIFDPSANNVTTIAFVLVSHGPNGVGAFDDAGARTPVTAETGAGELENMNGDNIFVWSPEVGQAGALHFDDRLVWRTQDQIYAELGNLSCNSP